MGDDFIINALSKLFAIDDRLGPYRGHSSTCKGVTFSTPQRDFVISVSFLTQIAYQPETLTKEKLLQKIL